MGMIIFLSLTCRILFNSFLISTVSNQATFAEPDVMFLIIFVNIAAIIHLQNVQIIDPDGDI